MWRCIAASLLFTWKRKAYMLVYDILKEPADEAPPPTAKPNMHTKNFASQFTLQNGQWMCSAAATVVAFIITDNYLKSVEDPPLAETIAKNQLDYIMKVALRVYHDTEKTLQNKSSKMLMTTEVVQYLTHEGERTNGLKWRFKTNVKTKDIGGLVQGTTEDGLQLPSLRSTIETLKMGQAIAITARAHTTACGCDGNADNDKTYWRFDSGTGRFTTYATDVAALVADVVHNMRPHEEWSGTLFTSPNTDQPPTASS